MQQDTVQLCRRSRQSNINAGIITKSAVQGRGARGIG